MTYEENKMKVNTYLFGEIEVNLEQVLTFPNGLAAFENFKRFMLVHEEDKGAPVSFTMQSLDEPTLALQVIDPAAVGFAYELALTDEESALLQAPTPDDLAVMLVLYKRNEDQIPGIGANIRAPLILNTRTRVGMQKIIDMPRPNVTISNLARSV